MQNLLGRADIKADIPERPRGLRNTTLSSFLNCTCSLRHIVIQSPGKKSWSQLHSTRCWSFACVLQCQRKGVIAAGKKKTSWPYSRNNHCSPVHPHTSLSLLSPLSHSLYKAPDDSDCILPSINHSPYSIGYMLHGKYWFFPLPHHWRTHVFLWGCIHTHKYIYIYYYTCTHRVWESAFMLLWQVQTCTHSAHACVYYWIFFN